MVEPKLKTVKITMTRSSWFNLQLLKLFPFLSSQLTEFTTLRIESSSSKFDTYPYYELFLVPQGLLLADFRDVRAQFNYNVLILSYFFSCSNWRGRELSFRFFGHFLCCGSESAADRSERLNIITGQVLSLAGQTALSLSRTVHTQPRNNSPRIRSGFQAH